MIRELKASINKRREMIYSLKSFRGKLTDLKKKVYETIFSEDLSDELLEYLYKAHITLVYHSILFEDIHKFNPYCGINLLDAKIKEEFSVPLYRLACYLNDVIHDNLEIDEDKYYFEGMRINLNAASYIVEKEENIIWIAFKALEKINKIDPLERKEEEYNELNEIILNN